MTGLVFANSKVFVCRSDLSDPAKQEFAQQWIESLVHTRADRLSYEVLQGDTQGRLYTARKRRTRGRSSSR